MKKLNKHFHIDDKPEAKKDSTIIFGKARFTILTEKVIRIEYDPKGEFDDRASQVFWYRNIETPEYILEKSDYKLVIETKEIKLFYKANIEFFNEENLKIFIKEKDIMWHYGDQDEKNLFGTYRTLDAADGKVDLEKGLISEAGWSVVDDTDSLVFGKNRWLKPRNKPKTYLDLYFFGYGDNYLGCLKDFNKIAGKIPLIPRWALGNWWSRYWEYSQDELKSLMLKFKNNDVSLSVCIIDMDWHIVNNNYSRGWTGYTWNNDLFPNPPKLINWLHDQGLKTALNLHPADGVHPHEKKYEQMVEAMNLDAEEIDKIDFDLSDLDFINNYFTVLHNPIEDNEGVDFWWLDWQQGKKSKLPGLDPLWGLNHLHYYDLGREDKRNFIFSRWSGLGSHRYPIGFSGDTVVSWDSLRFQPYFTSTAANVCYGWWSHDIGGHCMGVEDSELYTRWVQFGVFSPIMRLHSTKDEFMDRTPWGHGKDVFEITKDYMKLRHKLIPYIYTMNWQSHQTGVSLIRPMYYHHKTEEAYSVPDQYYFGSEIVVAPYLDPKEEETGLSKQIVWLPKGEWFDFFDGEKYKGNSWHIKYGDLSETNVFAKAGAIIPMNSNSIFGEVSNPKELVINVFPGDNNEFKLYEDQGEGKEFKNGKFAITTFKNIWEDNQQRFKVSPVKGNKSVLPVNRILKIKFRNIKEAEEVILLKDDEVLKVDYEYDLDNNIMTLFIKNYNPDSKFEILLNDRENLQITEDKTIKKITKLLNNFKMKTAAKTLLIKKLKKDQNIESELFHGFLSVLSQKQVVALLEVIYGCGIYHINNGNVNKLVFWNGKLNNSKYNLAKYSLLKAHPRKEVTNINKKIEEPVMIDYKDLRNYLWDLKIIFNNYILLEFSN